MTDVKATIEARIWAFIMAHRSLKVCAYAVAAIGIIGGAYTAVEKPISWAIEGARYALGIAPKPDQVLMERNAFFVGMILRDLSAYGLDSPFGGSRLRRLEKAYVALGFQEPEMQNWSKLETAAFQIELLRSRERLEGHLEKSGQRNLEFFQLGYQLSALVAESPSADGKQLSLRNNEVMSTYARISKLASYRLPTLPLRPLDPTKEPPKDYASDVVQSFLKLKDFLGA